MQGVALQGAKPRVHAAFVCVQLLVAGVKVAGKAGLRALPPWTFLSLRFLLALPVQFGLPAILGLEVPGWRDMLYLAVLGFFGNTLMKGLQFLGMQTCSPSAAGVVAAVLPPVLAACISRPNLSALLALGLSVSGAVIVVTPSGPSVAQPMAYWYGVLFSALGTGSSCAYELLLPHILRRLPQRTVLAYVSLYSTLFTVVWTMHVEQESFESMLRGPGLWNMTSATWVAVLYCALAVTVISSSCNAWAIRHSSPSLSAAYKPLMPPCIVLFEVILTRTLPPVEKVVGAALVAVGLVGYAKSRQADLTRLSTKSNAPQN